MSTSKTFTYPVTVVAYREPDKYAAGVAELYVNGKYLDWCILDNLNVDFSNREYLEDDDRGDVADMLDFDEKGDFTGDIKTGCEESFFEWAVTELMGGGHVLDTNLYFECSLSETFGERASAGIGECCDYWFKAGNGAYVIAFTLESPEPLKLHGEPLRDREFWNHG